MVERIIIMNIPAMSSITSVPNTSCAKLFFVTPSSSNALIMMVVELMESMPPRKILSITPQPSSCPVT